MNDTLQGITRDFSFSAPFCSKPVNIAYNLWFRATLLETARAKQQLYCFQPMPRFHWFRFWHHSHVSLKCNVTSVGFLSLLSQTTPSSSWSLRLIERECFEWGSLHWFYSNLIIQITCFLKHVFFVKQVSAKIFRGRSPERWSSTSQRPPLPSRTKPEFLEVQLHGDLKDYVKVESYYRSKVCFHIAMKPHPTHCQQQCNQSWYLEVWKETTGPRERCLLKFRFSTDTKHLRVMWSTLPGFGSSVLSPKLWSFQCKYAQYITIYI